MTISRLKPLTVKEIEKLAATPPDCIRHRYLGGVPGFVLVHTPAGYTGYGLIYRAGVHGVYTALRARRPNTPEISRNGVFPRVSWSGRQDS